MKYYRIISIVLISLAAYMIMLPKISPVMRTYFPSIWRCPYKSITSKPCPFCGVTTDFKSLNTGKFRENVSSNSLSLSIYAVLWSEIFVRGTLLVFIKKIRKIKLLVFLDVGIHLVIICYYGISIINRLTI